jgi:hypothetical protein
VKIRKLVCFEDEMWRKIKEILRGRWKRRKEGRNNQGKKNKK